MLTEGRGIHAPRPHKVELTSHCLQVVVTAAKPRAELRNYRGKRSSWSNGMTGPMTINCHDGHSVVLEPSVAPIVRGTIGEVALAYRINRHFGEGTVAVDLGLHAKGDGGKDLEVFGTTIQVKTRRDGKHGNLIRSVTEHGRVLPIDAQVYVFCEWDRSPIVQILGCIHGSAIKGRESVPAPGGRKHRNIVIQDHELECIGTLMAELETRRGLAT